MLAGKNSSETLVYQGYCDLSLISVLLSRGLMLLANPTLVQPFLNYIKLDPCNVFTRIITGFLFRYFYEMHSRIEIHFGISKAYSYFEFILREIWLFFSGFIFNRWNFPFAAKLKALLSLLSLKWWNNWDCLKSVFEQNKRIRIVVSITTKNQKTCSSFK